MPRTTNAAFKREAEKQTNRPICLYTVEGDFGTLRFAEYNRDIVYRTYTFTAAAIQRSVLKYTVETQINGLNLNIGNADNAMSGYIETNDGLRGAKVTIWYVWKDLLSDSSAYIEEIYYIDSCTVTDKAAQFSLRPKLDIKNIVLPKRRFFKDYCQVIFKSTECGYAGADTTCKKTREDCTAKSPTNTPRFGAFPGIPGYRRVHF